jgi:cobalt-zinc-cadmium efflux system membrane fusion protein
MDKHAKLLLLLTQVSLALTGCTQKSEVLEAPAEKPEIKDTINLSANAIKRFGISIITVGERAQTHPIVSTGVIKADENNVFHINSLSSGRVVSDKVQLGDAIHAGQMLAVVENLEVMRIYGDYVHQAHQNEINTNLEETRLKLAKNSYDRMKRLFDERIGAEKDVIKAESDYKLALETVRGLKEHSTHIRKEAQAMLAAYGVKLGAIDTDHMESNSTVVAPRAGVIVKKNVTVGDVVTSTEPLYVVADLAQVWLDIAIYDKQVQAIQIGDSVTFKSDSLPGKTFSGHVSYIKPSTEDNSGTFSARAVLTNPQVQLKPGMLGQVKIESRRSQRSPFIPEIAVQKYGPQSFVFEQLPNGSYKKRVVDLGEREGDGYFVQKGLNKGEHIVGNGSFTLKAEMLKSTAEED